jgi:hypothetical protein
MKTKLVATFRSEGRIGQTERFVWHGALMAVAMWIGMGVYLLVLMTFGYRDLSDRYPYVWAISMTASMALGMAAWMLIRHHGAARTMEMSAAMMAPVIVVVVLCAAQVLPHNVIRPWTHILMWPAMYGMMLLRWKHYAQLHGPGAAGRRPHLGEIGARPGHVEDRVPGPPLSSAQAPRSLASGQRVWARRSRSHATPGRAA